MRFRNEEKAFLINLMIKAALADNNLHENESEYLGKLMASLEVDLDFVNKVRAGEVSYEVPEDEPKRMTILYYLLFLLQSDHAIGEMEERIAILAGFELGFNEVMVRNMVTVMRKYLGEEMPVDALLAHIKAQLN